MFPTRYQPQVFAFLMSMTMAFLMTGVVTAINTGTGGGFLTRWLHSFTVVWPLAFIIVLFLGQRVRALSETICRGNNGG